MKELDIQKSRTFCSKIKVKIRVKVSNILPFHKKKKNAEIRGRTPPLCLENANSRIFIKIPFNLVILTLQLPECRGLGACDMRSPFKSGDMIQQLWDCTLIVNTKAIALTLLFIVNTKALPYINSVYGIYSFDCTFMVNIKALLVH